jgi:geranylgeranyl reductase family protein
MDSAHAEPHECDVVVVGAGPGGACAALRLAQGGLRVVIVERARLPRYKTCGGGLLPRALRLLELTLTDELESACHAAELHHHQPDVSCRSIRSTPLVSMVMRDRFDLLLVGRAQSAGAILLPEESVENVVVHGQGVEVRSARRTIRARFVIGADGFNSVVARKAGLPPLHDAVPALESEATVSPSDLERFRSVARFDFGLTPHGYAWVFPKKTHLSVGVLTTKRGSCNLHTELARYYRKLGLNPIHEERHGYAIPLQPRRSLFSTPRTLLVGDAAGLADPITAEGISAAILSGQLAARAILEGGNDDAGTRAAYRSALKASLLDDLRIARLLARLVYRWPRLRAWAFAHHGPRLTDFMTRVVAGETTYRASVAPRRILRAILGRHSDGR